MDALLSALVAALIAEQGDTSQLLAATVAAGLGVRVPVLLAIASAVAVNAALAAAGGAALHGIVPHRATTLLTALALLAAGAGALFAAKAPKVVLYARLAPPAAAFVAMLVLGFGDKTQFLTLALAARSDAPALAGVGALLGTLAGMAPALVLGVRFGRWPARQLRWAAAAMLLLAGSVVALTALRLI